MKKLNIAVVGASISGLAVAAQLIKDGHKVTIYEKRRGNLKGHGAGITMTPALHEQLLELGLLDHSTPTGNIKERIVINQSSNILDKCDFSAITFHWSTIYDALRKQVPNAHIQMNSKVTSIYTRNMTLEINGAPDENKFDFIIGADGHDSTIVKAVYPDLKPRDEGYIVWRGTVPLENLTHDPDLKNRIELSLGTAKSGIAPYYTYPDGHCLMYLIHDTNGKLLINWALYEKRTPESLEDFLQKENGQYKTIPRGELPEKQLRYLNTFIKYTLPRTVQVITLNTEQPFVQPVVTTHVPHRTTETGNVIFIGDAAGTIPPHAGKGAVKGIHDAIAVAKALRQKDPTNAIKEWAKQQAEEDEKLFALSGRMRDFWVKTPPNWAKLSPQDFTELWAKVIAGEPWYTAPAPTSKQPTATRAKL